MRTAIPILTLLFAAATGNAEAQVFRIDPAKSELVARTFKDGVASGLAHDHIVRASKVTGEVQFAPARPAEAKLSIEVDVASLAVDEPEMRKKHRVPKTIGEGDRQKIRSSMLGEDQLDAKKHPSIRFESTKVEGGGGRFTLEGRLTLHGTTRAIRFPIEVQVQGDILRARGSFTIRQTEFGIEPYSAALGTVKNKDEVTIGFSVFASRESTVSP